MHYLPSLPLAVLLTAFGSAQVKNMLCNFQHDLRVEGPGAQPLITGYCIRKCRCRAWSEASLKPRKASVPSAPASIGVATIQTKTACTGRRIENGAVGLSPKRTSKSGR